MRNKYFNQTHNCLASGIIVTKLWQTTLNIDHTGNHLSSNALQNGQTVVQEQRCIVVLYTRTVAFYNLRQNSENIKTDTQNLNTKWFTAVPDSSHPCPNTNRVRR